jgi:hypothetical protein
MRVRLKGINSSRKQLADRKWRTYWYAWKGGPPLRGERGTPEFVASYTAAVATKVTPSEINWLGASSHTSSITFDIQSSSSMWNAEIPTKIPTI